jgi:hypothetical protein
MSNTGQWGRLLHNEQFAEPVIPDELRFAERDPESSERSI